RPATRPSGCWQRARSPRRCDTRAGTACRCRRTARPRGRCRAAPAAPACSARSGRDRRFWVPRPACFRIRTEEKPETSTSNSSLEPLFAGTGPAGLAPEDRALRLTIELEREAPDALRAPLDRLGERVVARQGPFAQRSGGAVRLARELAD